MSRQSTIVLVDTPGGTAPEFITAALATHPGVNALPGLAFVRDGLRLYRRHDLAGLDGDAIFDRLWQPSYEPGGRLWAGVARHLAPAARDGLPVAAARALFRQQHVPGAGYLATLGSFAVAVLQGCGWWRDGATHVAVCGVPFLKTVPWDELARPGCVLVEAAVPLDTWLALISHRSIVRCPHALVYWIIHKLLYRLAARRGIRVLRCDAISAGQHGTVDDALLGQLGLEAGRPRRLEPGPGHQSFSPATFAHVTSLARDIAAIYGATPLYALARDVDDWAGEAVLDAELSQLLAGYLRYWETTAHVHFDTSGPCEQAIAARVIALRGLPAAPPADGDPGASSRDFYERLVDFQSYDFETPRFGTHTWLGALEERISLPHAPYFLHAAVCYLEHCLAMQGKWFDSYQPLGASDLYRRLTSPAWAASVGRLGFAERLGRLAGQDEDIRRRASGRLQP